MLQARNRDNAATLEEERRRKIEEDRHRMIEQARCRKIEHDLRTFKSASSQSWSELEAKMKENSFVSPAPDQKAELQALPVMVFGGR